jgi:hypothetical protein
LKKIFLALICTIIAFCAPSRAWADAAEPALIGSYDGWKAYHFRDKSGPVCFMSRAADKQEGKFKKRGKDVVFFVTHYSADKDKNVVSVSGGYDFKPKEPVTLSIKGKKFPLFAQGGMAWTKDQTEDNAVIKEILAGATMTVKGTSSRGTATTDTYNLKGSTEAYRAITKDCGTEKDKK